MQLIETLLKHLHDHHVLPEVAARAEEHIRPRTGEYAAIACGQELSERLTADLQAIDKSLAVGYSANPFPPQSKPEEPNTDQLKVRELGIVLDNAGFGGETAAAAMAFLSGTDALILDLRTNGGGPVYVLTSRQTFSAAEELSYDLKHLKRATIVGESTSGDVHRGRRYQLDDHFEAFIPGARFVSAITGINWEGTGVLPDITVPAEQALKTAYAEALRQVIAKSDREPLSPWRQLRQEAQKALSELT